MTASELKYLMAANELNDNGKGAKMAAMALKVGVSKVSVSRAIERLIANGYAVQNGKKILLTKEGISEIASHTAVIDFIAEKLQRHCNAPRQRAFDEALAAACALSEDSRSSILKLAENKADKYSE